MQSNAFYWSQCFHNELYPFAYSLTLNRSKAIQLVNLCLDRIIKTDHFVLINRPRVKDKKLILSRFFTLLLQVYEQNRHSFERPREAGSIERHFIPFSELPVLSRATLFLRHQLQLNTVEIAEHLSLSVSEVTTNLNQGRKSLLEMSGEKALFYAD